MRYGDLLRDLRNPNLSRARLDEIVRIFNEFGDREEKYRSWTQPIDSGIDSAAIRFPFERIFFNELEYNTASLRIPIPPDYKHLLITGIGRTTATPATAQEQSLNFTFNDDTNQNYQWSAASGGSYGASGQSNDLQSNLPFGMFNTDNCPANTASSFWCFIPHYNGPFWKMALAIVAGQRRAADAKPESALFTGFWKNTNPIFSMTAVPGGGLGGQLKAGSVVSVYGIL